MKKKYIRVIYLITYIITAFSIISTLFYYFYTPSKSTHILPQNKIPLELLEADIEKILERNIFNKSGVFPDIGQIKEDIIQCTGTPKKSSLPYNVVGIIYGGSSQTSMVMLQNKNTEHVIILQSDEKLPQNEGHISNIEPKRVWITQVGCPEYLELPPIKLPPSRTRKGSKGAASDRSYAESGFERVGTNTNVTRDWVDDILNNKLSSVLNDAFVTPHMINGRVDGFTISQIEPMSVFDKLGLKNGDVITAINGIPLNDAGRAIQTLNGLRNESEITMKVLRNGQPTTFKVNVQK